MSKIISISTSVPAYRHKQQDILSFMQRVYAMNEVDKRKLKFLYHQSAIDERYSVVPDYSLNADEWQFYPATENLDPFPSLEHRMKWYNKTAAPLSVKAIEKCIEDKISKEEITHLITVSCTGMSAPGLDLQIMEEMNLSPTTYRTSINFMGCYAAIHGLKMADAICNSDKAAKVLIVCTELCTLHFQRENTIDNIASSLLFGDGCAAVLIAGDNDKTSGLRIKNFYSEVAFKGKKDMSWELSSSGFLMTLSGYVPDLIEQDFNKLLNNALVNAGIDKNAISHWCIHPGGKRILTSIEKSIDISSENLRESYNVLRNYGNMSSPTILFVLKEIMDALEIKNHKSKKKNEKKSNIFGAAFGPGLTMETFILAND
ncbi:MAG: type III polyketide synthase [Bacteroidota bacterium]|nr:type III polyketide synthase [Bacteroidota bacterium]